MTEEQKTPKFDLFANVGKTVTIPMDDFVHLMESEKNLQTILNALEQGAGLSFDGAGLSFSTYNLPPVVKAILPGWYSSVYATVRAAEEIKKKMKGDK